MGWMDLIRPGRRYTEAEFAEAQRGIPRMALVMALKSVNTPEGAWRIYRAEKQGRNRIQVLRSAERRIAELVGSEPISFWPKLVVRGRAAESASFNPNRKKLTIVT